MKLPLPEYRRYDWADAPADFAAALAVLFLSVPQALAYATIAGLPPAMGLYAAAWPAIFGTALRSSRHVVPGPTNALALLVGAALASVHHDPVMAAITLAFMVGILQTLAGLLRLGAVVDYISSPVVLGYITGAGILIGVGQLYNLSGTEGESGRIWTTVGGWVATLPDAQPLAFAVAGGTVAVIVGTRLLSKVVGFKIPGAIVAMVLALIVNVSLDLEGQGLKVISDIQPVPRGMPPLSVPDFGMVMDLIPGAVACTVLSLVESSAVGRSIATYTGQRVEASAEFVGQGIANLTAAFTTGFPVSGSLSRSALNFQAGARTRVAGVVTGLMILPVLLLFGGTLNHTPVASLAGLLMVVAWDLVDVPRIKEIVTATPSDRVAFGVTLLGTWVLSLDMAIYAGVGISIVLFLRNARLLTVSELVVGADGHVHELQPEWDEHPDTAALAELGGDAAVRIMNVEGATFFGAAGELNLALDHMIRDPAVKAVVVRLKRTQGMDVTAANVFKAAAERLQGQGRHLLLAGMEPDAAGVLDRAGVTAVVGADNTFPTTDQRFEAMHRARARAVELTTAPDRA